jgi:hypothetical protein
MHFERAINHSKAWAEQRGWYWALTKFAIEVWGKNEKNVD